jgi:hypothetical protein
LFKRAPGGGTAYLKAEETAVTEGENGHLPAEPLASGAAVIFEAWRMLGPGATPQNAAGVLAQALIDAGWGPVAAPSVAVQPEYPANMVKILAQLLEQYYEHGVGQDCVNYEESAKRFVAGWTPASTAPPAPQPETEWGYRTPGDDFVTQSAEEVARRWVAFAHPGMRTLVSRTVGPWTAVTE